METTVATRTLELVVLDQTGDTKTVWDADNEEEVSVARTMFNDLKKKGFAIFRAEGKKGEKGEAMHKFDPDAGKMIAVPAVVGG